MSDRYVLKGLRVKKAIILLQSAPTLYVMQVVGAEKIAQAISI